MFKTRFISMLVLLMTAVSGAWAQTETLLTTITATAKEQASYSTANVATVSFSYTSGGSSAYLAQWGWWGYGWIATVNAAEGYTITKCIFYDDANRTATDSEAPFVVETTEEDKTPRINETPIDGGNMWSKGIKKIDVYGYAAPAGYSVALKDGTEDASNWQGKAGSGEYQSLPLTGLEAGTAVTVKYNGTKKVKSVKAIKKTVPVTAITLNKTETSIKVGATETLSVTAVAPDNATDKSYTWKTSDETKATVDQDGKVTAVAAGTVTIYAEANDGSGVKGNCTVTVAPAAAEGHALSASAVGEIVGTDGKAYAASDKDNLPSGVTAVAMIAYVGTASDCTHGLAIALADESGMKNYWAAGTACSGKAAVTGGTWRLPSIKDWQYMFIGCGASGSYSASPSNMSYSGLASKLTTAQGDAFLRGDEYYWSSTEYSPGDGAWSVRFGVSKADFCEDWEEGEYRVRACLAF